MNEFTLEVAAGLNSTLTQVTSFLRWVIVSLTSVLLDEEETLNSGRNDLVWWFGFTSLQSYIFKVLAVILIVLNILIAVAWYAYGSVITRTLSYNSLHIVEEIHKRNTNFKVSKDSSTRP